jgi:hypothetical protein
MKGTLAILSVVIALSPTIAFGQANPNQGVTTGTESNRVQRDRSVPGNPANPGPRENPAATGTTITPDSRLVNPGDTVVVPSR